MRPASPPCTYFELSATEFFERTAGAQVYLCDNWEQSNLAPNGTLRAVKSGLLPWKDTDVLAWPSGALMVSLKVWSDLGGP